MGLLDSLTDDPTMSFAMGLLNASGPSARPVSLGQGIAQGYGAMSEARKNALQTALLKAQVADAQKKSEINTMLMNRFAPQSAAQSALNQGAQLGDIGPTLTNAARMTAPSVTARPDPFANIPPEAALLELANNGGKELGKWAYESNKPNIEFINGVAVDKNRTQAGTSIPQISTTGAGYQIIPDQTAPGGFRVQVPQGSAEAYKQFKNIDASTQAGYDLQTVTPPDGRPVMTTRKALVESMNPSDAAAVAAWKAAGSPGPDKPFNMTVGGIPLQSEEDKARTSASVEVDKGRALRQAEKGQGQENILIPLQEIQNRLKDPSLVLGNTPADRAKMIGHQYGMQSKASINTQRIREIANQLTLANGSLGAGVSNADTKIYQEAQGKLSEAKSYEDMKDAVETMVRIASKYQQRDTQVQGELRTGKRSVMSPDGWSATVVR